MAKKRVVIRIEKEYTFEYDPNSKQFKEALESYKGCIDKGATEKSMVEHVAFYIDRFGTDGMVEGVGYIKDGSKVEEPYSGISVDDSMPYPVDIETL